MYSNEMFIPMYSENGYVWIPNGWSIAIDHYISTGSLVLRSSNIRDCPWYIGVRNAQTIFTQLFDYFASHDHESDFHHSLSIFGISLASRYHSAKKNSS